MFKRKILEKPLFVFTFDDDSVNFVVYNQGAISYAGEKSIEDTKKYIQQLVSSNSGGLDIIFLLDYSEYTIIQLTDIGIQEPELTRSLKWQCQEYVKFESGKGIFVYSKPSARGYLNVLAVSESYIKKALKKLDLTLNDLRSVDFFDFALANLASIKFDGSMVTIIDSTKVQSRIIFEDESMLEMFDNLPPATNGISTDYIKDVLDNVPYSVGNEMIVCTISNNSVDQSSLGEINQINDVRFLCLSDCVQDEFPLNQNINRKILACYGGALYHAE